MIIMQLLLGISVVLSILGRTSDLPVFVFWIFMSGMVVVTYLIVRSQPERYKLLSLVILSLTISGIHIAALPHVHQLGTDDVFEAQYSNEIVQNGKWDPALGAGFAENYYGYNPVLHLLVSFVSVTTGISSYVLVKYFFFTLFRLMFVFMVLMLLKKITTVRLAYIATLIFTGSAGMMFIGVTRRNIASLLLLLAVYTILKGRSHLWYVLFIFFSMLLLLANHSIALYFLIFLFGLWVFSWFTPIPSVFPHLSYYVAVLIMVQYATGVFLREDIGYVKQTLVTLLDFNVVPGSTSLLSYHSYELFLIYSSQVLFMLLGGIGLLVFLYFFLKKRKVRGFSKPWFTMYLAFFGFTAYALSSFLMTTPLDVAVFIILWFFGVPICMFVAYTLIRMRTVVAIAVVLILFSGALMMGIFTPRLTNRMPYEDIVISSDNRALTKAMDVAGEWLSDNHGPAYILSDSTVFEMFSGHYGHQVYMDDYWLDVLYHGPADEVDLIIERDNFDFGKYAHANDENAFDYLVINRLFSEYPSEQFGQPIEIETGHLETNPQLDRVYANDQIVIYKVRHVPVDSSDTIV